MSISEACYLVLESINNINNDYQIFMIDMGEEILIYDIAKKLIQLNGYKVNKDIKINFGMLKKGEKISEKLNYNFESISTTNTKKLLALSGNYPHQLINFDQFKKNLKAIIYDVNKSSKEIELMIKSETNHFI